MKFLKPIISRDQEKGYRSFMLRYETYSLRIACLIGAIYLLIFLIIDYWRVENYEYVVIFRFTMIVILVASVFIISRTKFSVNNFYILCLFISGSVVLLSFPMDFTAGMPQYFLPNFLCLLLYVFNTGLGYPLRLKSIFTCALLIGFLIYAYYVSPHRYSHLSQVWNIITNMVISILIGFLIERYKRINFLQRNELQVVRNDLKSIFDAAAVSIIGTDTNGTIVHFSKGAEGLLGYTADEMVGKHTPALIHLDSEVISRGIELTQLLNREIKGFDVFVEFAKLGKPETREWTYIRKDGIMFPVQLVVTAIRGLNDTIVGFLGIATDITELKTQSIIIEKQNRELETLNATKDRFFSIVAHDLKSPLNSLKAFSGLLIGHYDKLSKDEILTMSRQLNVSVENTIKMADNLITWARIQMNDFHYNQQVILVQEIVATTCEIYHQIASEKGIDVSCSLNNSLKILGDKNQIEFIIRNLINNAIKYTHKGGFVKLTAMSEQDDYVEISVSDSGSGISDSIKEQLFKIGKKRSADGTAGEKGTGLGLMLSYEFVHLNAGQIYFESKLGEGTTFYVKFKSAKERD